MEKTLMNTLEAVEILTRNGYLVISKTELEDILALAMERDIIKELKKKIELEIEFELYQVGMIPRTTFKGNQEQHDEIHLDRAKKLEKILKVLKEIENEICD